LEGEPCARDADDWEFPKTEEVGCCCIELPNAEDDPCCVVFPNAEVGCCEPNAETGCCVEAPKAEVGC